MNKLLFFPDGEGAHTVERYGNLLLLSVIDYRNRDFITIYTQICADMDELREYAVAHLPSALSVRARAREKTREDKLTADFLLVRRAAHVRILVLVGLAAFARHRLVVQSHAGEALGGARLRFVGRAIYAIR